MPETRKKLYFAAALVVAFALLLVAGQPLTEWLRRQVYRQPGPPAAYDVPERTSYVIQAEFEPASRKLTATQEIVYLTPADAPVQTLVLHLYANAFARGDALPQPRIKSGQITEQLFPGNITVSRLRVNGQERPFTVEGTILEIPLADRLTPGSPVQLNLEWEMLVPVSVGRLGVFRGTALFGNWYPTMAVYERGSWRRDPYYAVGDPFYSDTANYRVEVSLPKGYPAVATGAETSRRDEDDRTIYSWRATNVRDFVWSTSDKYQVLERQAGDVLVRSAFFGERHWGELALDLAVQALAVYERLFGPYPYEVYTVAEAQLRIFGGMEYPGFIVMSPYGQRDTRVAESARIEREVAHETAHQWWYASVGSDQILEPWLDEAMATYFASIYFAEVYGPQELATFRNDRLTTPNLPVNSPITAFSEWRPYWLTVYVKGSYLLDELNLRVGSQVFYQIMREYYQNFSGKLASTQDFVRVISQVAGPEHATWFAQRLRQP